MNQTKILFVCHGNICRSPMAEFLFKKMLEDNNLLDKYIIDSAATSTEEIGNGVHCGTRKILDRFNIDYKHKTARQIKMNDYDYYDYIIGMDSNNMYNIRRFFNNDKDNKIYKLLDFSINPRDISDPWYTNDFDTCYNDINEGLIGLLNYLEK
jgi:protein-tyrosine phosphatase